MSDAIEQVHLQCYSYLSNKRRVSNTRRGWTNFTELIIVVYGITVGVVHQEGNLLQSFSILGQFWGPKHFSQNTFSKH